MKTSVTIVVLSDGETWEVLSDEVRLYRATGEQFAALVAGERPKNILSSAAGSSVLELDAHYNEVRHAH